MNKYCTLLLILSLSAFAVAQIGAQPNCQDLNVYLNANGNASFRMSEFVTNGSTSEITITRSFGGVVYGPILRSANSTISFNACDYLHETLKMTATNSEGSCWSYLTFKQSNGPILNARTKDVYCFDPLVSGGHIDDEPPTASIPCAEDMTSTFVADWITTFECGAPGAAVNDTVKVIYREYEAFDKKGNRGFTFDTLVVFRLPGLDPGVNLYCAEKDTTYCGEGNAGPFIIYPERCDPMLFGQDQDGDGVACDTIFLLEWNDSLGRYLLNPFLDDTKCGVLSHLDYWSFGGSGCDEQSKYILEVKQECVPLVQTSPCFITLPDNAFTGANGYWRCEFWMVDLDTLPPDLYCKGEELFSGPFALANWDISTISPTLLTGTAALIEDPSNTLDQSNLPHQLIFESEYNEVIIEDPEVQIAANGFFQFSQAATLDYEATAEVTFDFNWIFDLGPLALQDDTFLPNMGKIAGLVPALYTQIAFYYEINGDYYRIIDGEEIIPAGLASGAPELAANVSLVSIIGGRTGRLAIPLKKGDVLSIRAFWDSPFDAKLIFSGNNIAITETHECAAKTYIPDLYAMDDWTGVKQVKASIEGVGTYTMTYDEVDSCWVSHDKITLNKKEDPYKIIYEAYDSCHNIAKDSCYIFVKDRIRPVPVVDKGVTVSLSDKKVWVDAETFDEGSWDNCGINLLLVRRADWYTACIDLCDSMALACTGTHGDSLYVASLEPNKHKTDTTYNDDVEAHYAKNLDWWWEDSVPCGELIYNAWQYDLMKYATLECVDHSYDVDAAYFRKHFEQCYQDYYAQNGMFGPGSHSSSIAGESKYYDLDPGSPVQYVFDRFKNLPNPRGLGHRSEINTKSCGMLSAEVDLYEQLGGGWSDAVPFSCEDACGPVTVEILVMDYWCNWAKAWTNVWVEDKTPIQVVKDVIDESNISCKTYKEKRYPYADEIHPVSLDYVVAQAKLGEQDAFDLLDDVFGGYCKAWKDPYGNYVDNEGTEIVCDISFYDSICQCTSYYDQVRVYDDHLGYIWKDSLITHCDYYQDTLDFQKGIVVVNCEENVYCEQEVWCEFDHCGQGYIFRKFKIWQGCPDSFYVEHNVPDSLRHGTDTIYRHQRIWVGNECELNKYMFDVPGDTIVNTCNLEYDGAGNVIGDAGPENTGYATYKLEDDCRLVGIAHQDQIFKVVGGDVACYKILRTWYFADWCGSGGTPVSGTWWHDYELVVDSCVQKIIVNDETPPLCTINIPVVGESGGSVEVSACAFNLSATVSVLDSCGVSNFYWELKNITDTTNVTIQDSGDGQLGGDFEEDFEIESADIPHGSYKLKVVTVDECNNEGYCEYFFDVISVKKPSPVCVTSLTARLTPWDSDGDGVVDSAHAVVWAGEFDSSSEPACQDTAIQFRIEFMTGDSTDDSAAGDADSLALGCADVGTHRVRMWVVSLPSDTRDYCDVVLIVQTDGSGCTGTEPGEREPLREVSGMQEETKAMDQSMLSSGQPNRVAGVGGRPASIQNQLVKSYVLEQNIPNPFQAETSIGFVLPEAMEASISVYDVTGRVIRTVTGNYGKGYNQVQFRKTDLGVSGLLYYRLNAGSFATTRKMILMK